MREIKSACRDPDLRVQLDVFEEQRESDQAQTAGPHDVDLSSHLDVFYTVYNRVQDTPQEIPFLSILQHLLRIDPKEAVSDIIWDTAVWSGEIKIFVGKHKNISGDAGAPRHADGEQGGQ